MPRPEDNRCPGWGGTTTSPIMGAGLGAVLGTLAGTALIGFGIRLASGNR